MKEKKQNSPAVIRASHPETTASSLLGDIRSLIEGARVHVASAVNTGLVLLYWRIGKRIGTDILREKRAEYGDRIVETLSRQLTQEYGRGFTRDALFRMVQFAERFPDSGIVGTLSRQLGWSHFAAIVPLRDPLQRVFYAEMCRLERWSVRMLRQKIASMLFERTSLSRKPIRTSEGRPESVVCHPRPVTAGDFLSSSFVDLGVDRP